MFHRSNHDNKECYLCTIIVDYEITNEFALWICTLIEQGLFAVKTAFMVLLSFS